MENGTNASPERKLVAASVNDGGESGAILHLARDSIPWHHRALAWGLASFFILLCGLASGWLLDNAASGQLSSVDPVALAFLRNDNEALRAQIDRLKALGDGDVCKLNTSDGRISPQQNTANPTGDRHLSTADMRNVLEEEVAWVVVNLHTPDKRETGSGFFIGPDLFVTNAHVVEDAGSEPILVGSKSLNGLRPATLLFRTTLLPQERSGYVVGQRDYAILRVPGANRAHPLSLRVNTIAKLSHDVIAAGYPGVDLVRDPALHAGGMPEVSGERGDVEWTKAYRDDLMVIRHTAQIYPGNSGGPLLDACGNVAGIDTAVTDDSENHVHLNFALDSKDLVAYLRASSVNPQTTPEKCD